MNEPGRSAAKLLTVGEVARRSGIAVSAVHFYERRGLIAAWRSRGNQRRYERPARRNRRAAGGASRRPHSRQG